MLNIKEIAPKLTQKLSIAINDDEAVEFAEALIAEVVKGNEPVARICSGWELLFIGSKPIAEVVRKHGLKIGDGLYTLPPTAEQIANETAEACALTYLEDYDLTDIADRVRDGEWRKFVKEA